MTDPECLQWVKVEFYPIMLATPDEAILQALGNAKRWFNTHSAYPIVEMFATDNLPYVQLTSAYKNVHQVYPATQPDWILANYPVWSLLGITVIDNLTSDLILLGEAYKNFRYYMGTDFKWNFQKSDNPLVGPKLYLSQVPQGTTNLCVVGSARIMDNTDITSEHILDWVLHYTKALVKMMEGNTLRKSLAIGIQNDGQNLLDEGKEEMKALQERLAQEGRWTSFCRRF
jgi:hypothetical protein